MNTKATVLFVDDEERILRSLLFLFRAQYRVLATTDAREALDIIRRERVHVIVSDQRMPIMRGSELLQQVKEISPRTIRLLLTGYSEMDAIVSSVNEGEIFRYIAKPWDASDIRATVDKAAGIALSLQQIETELAQPATGLDQKPQPLGVLVMDEDEQTFLAVREALGEDHEVRWAANLDNALDLISSKDIAIIVSEVFLGKDDVTGTIKLLKQRRPDLVTLVLTSFQDTSTMIGLINQGQVYRFLPKPIRKGLLSMSLHSAVRHYLALRSRPALLQGHAPEPTPGTVDQLVPSRVWNYLGRLRGRTVVDGSGA